MNFKSMINHLIAGKNIIHPSFEMGEKMCLAKAFLAFNKEVCWGTVVKVIGASVNNKPGSQNIPLSLILSNDWDVFPPHDYDHKLIEE